ncbi:MAG: spore coat U domain-containing protein [Polaromonas sp.]|nr:spore coat U domain-containing protein [Polaromonas sp.]
MKKVIVVSVLSLISLLVAPAHAATATGNFDVNINLTSACIYAKTSDVVFNYTSFQATAQAQTTAGAFTVRCTNLLPYTMALDGAGSYTDAALNLAYTLSLSAANATGNGTAQTFGVSGSMALGQAGNCATPGGACTNTASANKTRTLTITY